MSLHHTGYKLGDRVRVQLNGDDRVRFGTVVGFGQKSKNPDCVRVTLDADPEWARRRGLPFVASRGVTHCYHMKFLSLLPGLPSLSDHCPPSGALARPECGDAVRSEEAGQSPLAT